MKPFDVVVLTLAAVLLIAGAGIMIHEMVFTQAAASNVACGELFP